MSLIRALQRQGILTELPPRPTLKPTVEVVVRLMPQRLTYDDPPLRSDADNNASFSASGPAASLTSTPRRTQSTIFRRDNLTVGTRVIIAQDADLRGEISVGSGTVIHPKATILALQGAISIGSNCIIEETAVIVNRRSTPVKIGSNNLFEVGCRIEAASIGSYNVFEVRSKVAQNVAIGSYSIVGAGCTVLPKPIGDDQLAGIFDDDEEEQATAEVETTGEESGATDSHTRAQNEEVLEELPDQTVVYGADSKRRLWSGEGAQQQAALHAKHLEYLRDAIPRVHKLKIIQGVRTQAAAAAAPASATSTASTS